jgi:predicted nicotinamide N-methyase
MDLNILVPPDERSRKNGSGDVVWPSSFALAKLIVHRPFMVSEKRVLELGCGLGLPSLAALLHANPAHVALSDRDTRVLSLAYKSSTQLNRARASVSRSTIEWADETTWPQQEFDILMGSDLLYERKSVPHLVRVLRNYLQDNDGKVGKQAVLVDPVGRSNRDIFTYAVFKEGMEVEEESFPGMDDFVLLSVTWSG